MSLLTITPPLPATTSIILYILHPSTFYTILGSVKNPHFASPSVQTVFPGGDYHLWGNTKNTKPSLFCLKGGRLTFEVLVKQMYCQHLSRTMDSLSYVAFSYLSTHVIYHYTSVWSVTKYRLNPAKLPSYPIKNVPSHQLCDEAPYFSLSERDALVILWNLRGLASGMTSGAIYT